jgi:iron(III) transport system ATP-binding protein
VAERYPHEFSGGQKQRIAIARALAAEPSVIVLDEPLSALDAQVRASLRSEIRSLQKRLGIVTIMVTHDQEEALAMADRIVVMNEGQIDQVGTPAEIYRKPTTAFVADFVGAMSFLDGVVSGAKKVRTGALDLVCADDRGLASGTPIRLGLRPEEVRVRGVQAGDENAVDVRVKTLEFLGPFCRARLQPESDAAEFVADFSANLIRDLSVAEGQRMTIALPPESLRIFVHGEA